MTIFDQIRTACAQVAEKAQFVRIDHDRIPAYARTLRPAGSSAPTLDPEHHFFGLPADTAAYVLILDTLNFGSGYFPHLAKLAGCSGYFTVATRLKHWFETHGVPTTAVLTNLNARDCATIFHQDHANRTVMELMGHFAQALNDLGRYVQERFENRFTALIEAARASASNLVGILRRMPMFEDVATYAGIPVPFFKRAQLTAADLALALPESPWGRFLDLDQLTIFADNLVPHVLQMDGVLKYDWGLTADIRTGKMIQAGSPVEIEIRACALHAVEAIGIELGCSGQAVTSQGLDYLLWNRGQRKYYKAFARHRTRTVFY
jgi:hypothetical protein